MMFCERFSARLTPTNLPAEPHALERNPLSAGVADA